MLKQNLTKKFCAAACVLVMALSLFGTALTIDTLTVNAEGEEISAQALTTTPVEVGDEYKIYLDAGQYIAENNPSVSYGDYKEGYLLGLGRLVTGTSVNGYPGQDSLYPGYYNSVKDYIASHGTEGNYFDSVTECAKAVVALNAIGYDASDVDGKDITPQLSDSDNVSGVWADAYTLIALDTKKYESGAREIYLTDILSSQLADGSWGWDNATPDIDTTGIVLAALAPYYDSNESVKAAVDKAVNFLSENQAPSGAFSSYGSENSNSTAMVVLGLSELGINADRDERFIKNGVSAVDALCAFAVNGGGFGWTDNTEVNDYSTNQAFYSLCSYFRNLAGQNRLFDMTPEKNVDPVPQPAQSTDDEGTPTPAGTTVKVSKVPKTGDKLFII